MMWLICFAHSGFCSDIRLLRERPLTTLSKIAPNPASYISTIILYFGFLPSSYHYLASSTRSVYYTSSWRKTLHRCYFLLDSQHLGQELTYRRCLNICYIRRTVHESLFHSLQAFQTHHHVWLSYGFHDCFSSRFSSYFWAGFVSFMGTSLSFPFSIFFFMIFFLGVEAVSFVIPWVLPVAFFGPALVAGSKSQWTCCHHATHPVYQVVMLMVILKPLGLL